MTTIERAPDWETNNVHNGGDTEDDWNDSSSSSKLFERSRIKALAGKSLCNRWVYI